MGAAAASGTFLALAISITHARGVSGQGKRRSEAGGRDATSKKLSPALCTSIRSSSEPCFGTGSGASRVSWSLDGCAYSVMTSAFINGSERLRACGRQRSRALFKLSSVFGCYHAGFLL